MYQDNPSILKPNDENVMIWRYLSFGKFHHLIKSGALHFSRSDILRNFDKFEGRVTKKTYDTMKQLLVKSNSDQKWPPEEPEEYEKLIKEIRTVFGKIPLVTAVNCWHVNEYDSDAMWKRYVNMSEGLAVVSSFKRLKSCFDDCKEDVYIGVVEYDYDSSSFLDLSSCKNDPENKGRIKSNFNAYSALFHKKEQYKHERELRAVVSRLRTVGESIMVLLKGNKLEERLLEQNDKIFSNKGIDVPVNIKSLIGKIVVAPNAEDWFIELVRSETIKYGLNIEIVRSTLADDV